MDRLNGKRDDRYYTYHSLSSRISEAHKFKGWDGRISKLLR